MSTSILHVLIILNYTKDTFITYNITSSALTKDNSFKMVLENRERHVRATKISTAISVQATLLSSD